MNNESPDITKQRCDALLVSMLGGEKLAGRWWITPNRFFGGRTPLAAFDEDPTHVYQYLLSKAMGEW